MNYSSNKLITIGITAYNEGSYLQEAWESVINQFDNRWKAVMVLDGGADQKTKKIFNGISHPSLKKIRVKENKGPYHCRTLAINNAETDWYCHLDADDRFPLNAGNNVLATIDKYPEAKYIIGRCLYFDNNNFHTKYHTGITDPRLAYTLPFNGQSPIKCGLFNKVKGYNKAFYHGGADWDFWLNILKFKIKGQVIEDIIYERRYRQNNVGSSWITNRHKMVQQLINFHPEYFSKKNRKNICYSKSYELAAREYRRIGIRKEAATLAKKAIDLGNENYNLYTMISESKMPYWRYRLRRLRRTITSIL